eukprot:11248185-Alexandrium_andersonii.AAC.1
MRASTIPVWSPLRWSDGASRHAPTWSSWRKPHKAPLARGARFLREHPAAAASWQEPSISDCSPGP